MNPTREQMDRAEAQAMVRWYCRSNKVDLAAAANELAVQLICDAFNLGIKYTLSAEDAVCMACAALFLEPVPYGWGEDLPF